MKKKKKIDNPEIYESWKTSEEFYKNATSSCKPGIYMHEGQPGTGKTHSLAKMISETDLTIAFFTSNHNHIDKFKDDLKEWGIKKEDYIHGQGFERSCQRYPPTTKSRKKWSVDERLVYSVYNGFGAKSSRLLCSECPLNEYCMYFEYTRNSHKYRITLQPLEFLFTKFNSDKDVFVIDEVVSKKEFRLWNFNLTKIMTFVENIEKISKEDYTLKEYMGDILKLHRTLLQHTSLIFNESPETLFKINDVTFKTEEYQQKNYSQNGNLILHPENILLVTALDEYTREHLLNLSCNDESGILKFTDEQIRNAVKRKEIKIINKLIKNYIPLWEWFRFFEILLLKKTEDESCILVSERIEKIAKENIKNKKKEVTKTEGNYEWGFIDETPYVREITSDSYVISTIGKTYDGFDKKPEYLKDTWFTLGHPFMFQVFNIAKEKPVILLDATFNDIIFEKLFKQWQMHQVSKEIVARPTILPKIKKHVYHWKYPLISNKKSIVYDVGNHFPLESLDDNLHKIVGCIAKKLDDNPGKSHAIIPHKRYEKRLKKIFNEAEIVHHFNQRGKNIDSDLLFVIGTPYRPPKSIIYDYILTFNEYPENTDKRPGKRFTGYIDLLLHEILRVNVYDENYQELHRTRMFLFNKEVYGFCEIPEKIRKEVTVEPIPDINSISLSPRWCLIKIIIENEGITKSHLYNKTRNRKNFKAAGGKKKLLEVLETKGFITKKKEITKTKSFVRYYSTKSGLAWFKVYKKFFGVKKKHT